MKLHQLNPVPILTTDIPVKKEWLEIADQFKYIRMATGNGNYTEDKYVLNKLPDLRLEIAKVIEQFARDILKINKKIGFKFLNSWINIHGHKDFSHSHYHSNSLFSGVYYLKCEEGQGFLEFNNNKYNNHLSSLFNFEYDELNLINNSLHRFNARTGNLIIFPSSIPHSVSTNNSQEKRYSLAFNAFPFGKFGEPESQINLE